MNKEEINNKNKKKKKLNNFLYSIVNRVPFSSIITLRYWKRSICSILSLFLSLNFLYFLPSPLYNIYSSFSIYKPLSCFKYSAFLIIIWNCICLTFNLYYIQWFAFPNDLVHKKKLY